MVAMQVLIESCCQAQPDYKSRGPGCLDALCFPGAVPPRLKPQATQPLHGAHRQAESCNVFTYCPIQGGCPYGVNQTFPYQGCQLKNQPGSSLSPLYTPPAYSRGPPEAFTSGV